MKILIADDHLMTIEGYIALLEREGLSFSAFKALNCQEAYRFITSVSHLNIAILDYQLPEYKEKEIFSGVDLALLIKEYHPDCKIIMITAYQEATIIYDIYRKGQPDALIIKTDISYTNFKECLGYDNQYLSVTAQKAVASVIDNQRLINDANRQILFYLKQGFKVNELSEHLLMSTSGIQKRITKMKQLFNVTDVQSLVKEAVKRGFI